MPFDRILFDDGLKARAVAKTCQQKQPRKYTIQQYSDLNDLLGDRWHVRGLNGAGDYCYVIKDTVEFYLYNRRPLVDYSVGPDYEPVQKKHAWMYACFLFC